jgi:hypothetical protein
VGWRNVANTCKVAQYLTCDSRIIVSLPIVFHLCDELGAKLSGLMNVWHGLSFVTFYISGTGWGRKQNCPTAALLKATSKRGQAEFWLPVSKVEAVHQSTQVRESAVMRLENASSTIRKCGLWNLNQI